MDQATLLTELLTAAAEAHHTYQTEELGGENDEQWAEWYAADMARAMEARELRIVSDQ